MHGVGIRAMGRLMDKVMGAVHPADPDLPRPRRTSHGPYRAVTATGRAAPGTNCRCSGTTSRTPTATSDSSRTSLSASTSARGTSMRFFFPDSQDQVDPSFDFMTEQRSIYRVRQRDDRYAHEVIQPPPVRRASRVQADRRRFAGSEWEVHRSPTQPPLPRGRAPLLPARERRIDASGDGRLRSFHVCT